MSGAEYVMEIDVVPGADSKRQYLTSMIDMTLQAGGARISAGRYEVIIKRLPSQPKEERREQEEEDGEEDGEEEDGE